MTNKVGGIGKDVKHKHKEPKPIARHNYCFLCKDEFREYFSHIQSDTHKNSVHLQSNCYSQIDQVCHELESKWDVQYPNLSNISNRTPSCKKSTVVDKYNSIINPEMDEYDLPVTPKKDEEFVESFQEQLEKSEVPLCDSKEDSPEVKHIKSPTYKGEEVLLLFDEPNKDISNRIRKAKNTPNKFIPKDQLLNGFTPKIHKHRKPGSTLKRKLFQDPRPKSCVKSRPAYFATSPVPIEFSQNSHEASSHEIEGR